MDSGLGARMGKSVSKSARVGRMGEAAGRAAMPRNAMPNRMGKNSGAIGKLMGTQPLRARVPGKLPSAAARGAVLGGMKRIPASARRQLNPGTRKLA